MTDAAAAVEFVREFSPQIPFWPQLPQLSERERVIGQGLGAVRDLIEPRRGAYGYRVKPGLLDEVLERFWHGSGALAASHATGFYTFERCASGGWFPQAVAVKGQIEGPITLASYLFDGSRPFASDPVLFDAVTAHVSRLVRWQSTRLARLGLPVILFIDEPGLCITPGRRPRGEEQWIAGLETAIQAGRNGGAVVGLHCCAQRPFARMCRARPDILSFDAHRELNAFSADAEVRAFVCRGGYVAFGLIPTARRLDGLAGEVIFSRWLEAALALGDPVEIAQRSFVTATCGVGLLDDAGAKASFRLARRVSALIGRIAREGRVATASQLVVDKFRKYTVY
jgi:hypothetical protein